MLNNIGLPGLLFIVMWIVSIVALWKLLARSGSPGWLALFGLFPLIFFFLPGTRRSNAGLPIARLKMDGDIRTSPTTTAPSMR